MEITSTEAWLAFVEMRKTNCLAESLAEDERIIKSRVGGLIRWRVVRVRA